jgi:hypothetical protein
MQIIKQFLKKKRYKEALVFITGGSFILTPILFILLLAYKDTYFSLLEENKVVLKDIENERVKSANLTLEFTKYQNHQKILDLQEEYIKEYKYIDSNVIITEDKIEFL